MEIKRVDACYEFLYNEALGPFLDKPLFKVTKKEGKSIAECDFNP